MGVPIDIPLELVEQITKGNCVLFLGWTDDVIDTINQQAYTISEQIVAQRLAARIKYPKPLASLSDVAEYFEAESSRRSLIQYVCDVIDEYNHQLPAYYLTITNLPFNIIVSTSLDNFLPRILREQGKRHTLIVCDEEVSFIDDDKLLVVKLYGDVDHKASLVLTREDFVAFTEQLPNLSDLLKYYFRTKNAFGNGAILRF